MKTNIAVVGGGAFGCALCSMLRLPLLWLVREGDTGVVNAICSENNVQKIINKVRLSSDLVVRACYLFLAIPASSLKSFRACYPFVQADYWILTSKGCDAHTGQLPHHLWKDIQKNEGYHQKIAFFSGPHIARYIPTDPVVYATVSGDIGACKEDFQKIFYPHVVVNYQKNITLHACMASYKNVIACALGYARERGWSENICGILYSVGLYDALYWYRSHGNEEMIRGASGLSEEDYSVMMGAVVADTVTTVMSEHSRSVRLGVMMAKNTGVCQMSTYEALSVIRGLRKHKNIVLAQFLWKMCWRQKFEERDFLEKELYSSLMCFKIR